MSFADIVFWCTGLDLGVEGYLPGYGYARAWSMGHGFFLGLGSFLQGRPLTTHGPVLAAEKGVGGAAEASL
jgi:hypothetical protein